MGYDPVYGIATYGARCLPGTVHMFAYLRDRYSAGDLGCYVPTSKVSSGGPSLHAEGRAMDLALNANDEAERARGDALFDHVVTKADVYGVQEIIWREFIWTYNRRSEGVRGSEGLAAAHMSHVHLGVDVDTAMNWTTDRVGGAEEEMDYVGQNGTQHYHVAGVEAVAVTPDQAYQLVVALGLPNRGAIPDD